MITIEFQLVITVLSLLLGGFLLTGGRRKILFVVWKTLPRDILGAYRFFRLRILLWWWEKREYTVAKIFSNYAATHPQKIAYIFEDKEWTYEQLEHFSNRLGRYFRTKSYSHSDSMAILMENCPEYVGTWLGLSKAGFVGALINTNLRHDVLLHSINAANCKAIIFGSEFKDAIRDIKDKIPNIELFQWSERPDTPILEEAIDLNTEISSIDSGPLIVQLDHSGPRSKFLYIYTSGTTGMPKAAVINNLRYMFITCGMNIMVNIRSDDRIYDPLPLYHTAGGILGAGQALLLGVTVVLRRRFSVSKFWSDCVHYECTVAQYIGEICRFLLTVPPSQYDTTHKVRLMYGNGLRPQIWKSFVKRFGVKQIGEIYGATEGNSNLVNLDNKIGAVGFIPRYASWLYPVALLKIDEETAKPLRGPDGLCIPCKPGESGIFVGKINPTKAWNDFSGYADEKESDKKIIYDVFAKGDRVFNSGDILIMDKFGYFYFKDRTGDTFRWRGENVSTSEVEAVINNIMNFKNATVYGVEIPGIEGRAGMVAIYDPNNSLDFKRLEEKLKQALPTYARPLFIRILSELPMTGTFKVKKKDLQQEAFDIKKVKDPIYFLDKNIYIKMTDKHYNDIIEGKFRL
ncbi:long-chain fatty acid transport protein 4 [Linepithema humile]|uniref:long-chain fatty acid transport protein 4 n=1 Tax=Linepithema humile TaxID=83485 RepID=UPI000623506C|nr:PREDICTED: long-chain fatty acid transport protein 4 [Linepithema humile]